MTNWNLHVDYILCQSECSLSLPQSLLTDLLFGIPPSSDQFLNTARLCDTTAWGNIRHAIQRRAIHIIYPVTTSMLYWVSLQYAELPSLSDRCDKLCRDFFLKLFNPSNCIHHLLPPRRDTEIMSRLRRATTYRRPRNHTNCYKSFIHYALLKYQCLIFSTSLSLLDC